MWCFCSITMSWKMENFKFGNLRLCKYEKKIWLKNILKVKFDLHILKIFTERGVFYNEAAVNQA